jgi:peroxiredoxin family protein
MTPAEIDRLYQSVMLAAPMAAVGVVMFLAVWLWPVRRKP